MASSTAPTYSHTGNGDQTNNTGSGTQINNTGSGTQIIHGPTTTPTQDPSREELRISFLQALQKNGLADYAARKDINRPATEGTCLWFKNHNRFKTWLHSPGSSFLWVSADPGCGKSVLAKHLIDFSVLKKPEDKKTTLSYFFFKDTFDQQDVVHALCCILFQVFHQRPDLITDKLLQSFKVNNRRLTPSFQTIWPIFKDLIYDTDAGQIICVFDGVDECKEKHLPELVDKLKEIYNSDQGSANLKVIFLSRPYDSIHSSLIGQIPVIHLSGEGEEEMEQITKEIDLVITDRVKQLVRQKFLPNSPDAKQAEELLLEKILGVPNRTYLWAHLTLEMINDTVLGQGENLERKIVDITCKLPKNVEDAYEHILSKIQRPFHVAARNLLQLVVTATRPLSLREIYTALQITLKLDHHPRITPQSLFGGTRLSDNEIQQYVRECCSLFVVVICHKVYLLHQTAKEFLVRVGKPRFWQVMSRTESTWKSSIVDGKSHRLFSRACMACLLRCIPTAKGNSPVVERQDQSPSSVEISPHDLFQYAAENWAYHLRHSQKREQKQSLKVVMKLCEVSSAVFQMWFPAYWIQTGLRYPQNPTTRIVTAMLGLKHAVSRLLRDNREAMAWDTDLTYRRSALSWAATFGHYDVVKVLISTFWPNSCSRDLSMQTPLFHAILNGHQDIARTLVDAGVPVDNADNIGGTPLLYAMLKRQNELVDFMEQRGVNGKGDNTRANLKFLLLSAVREGNDVVLPLLLDIVEDPGTVTNVRGENLLQIALGNRNDAVVRALVKSPRVPILEEDIEWAAKYVTPIQMDKFLAVIHGDMVITEKALWEATGNMRWGVLIALLQRKGLVLDRNIEIAGWVPEVGAMEHIIENTLHHKVIALIALYSKRNPVADFQMNLWEKLVVLRGQGLLSVAFRKAAEDLAEAGLTGHLRAFMDFFSHLTTNDLNLAIDDNDYRIFKGFVDVGEESHQGLSKMKVLRDQDTGIWTVGNGAGEEAFVTERFLVDLMRDQKRGPEMLRQLVGNFAVRPALSERVIAEAAANSRQGWRLMGILLEHFEEEIEPTCNVVKAALNNKWLGLEVLRLLSDKKRFQVVVTGGISTLVTAMGVLEYDLTDRWFDPILQVLRKSATKENPFEVNQKVAASLGNLVELTLVEQRAQVTMNLFWLLKVLEEERKLITADELGKNFLGSMVEQIKSKMGSDDIEVHDTSP